MIRHEKCCKLQPNEFPFIRSKRPLHSKKGVAALKARDLVDLVQPSDSDDSGSHINEAAMPMLHQLAAALSLLTSMRQNKMVLFDVSAKYPNLNPILY